MKTKQHSSLDVRHSAFIAFGTALVAAGVLLLTGGAGYGGTLHLNGSSAYVWVGPQPELKVSGSSLTLEAWIKPSGRGSDLTEGGVILGREGEYLLARFADGTIRYAVATTSPGWGWVNTGIQVPSNQWTHVALTYDGSSFTFYTNGVIRAFSGGSGAVGDADAARNDFMIGNRQIATRLFQGQVDEARVWNVARSQDQIQASLTRPLAGNEPGLLACYSFDEGFGLTTADGTGRGLTGTLAGGAAWDPANESLAVPVPLTRSAAMITETTARLNASISRSGIAGSNSFWISTNSSTALSFNGLDNSVSFALGPNSMYNAYPLTVTAWVKTAAPGETGGLVNKYVSASGNGWQIYLLNGQVRAWYFRDNANRIAGDGNGLNGGNVDDGQWHHVAFTVAASGGKVYVDGRLTATNAWTGTAGATTTTQPLSFGVYYTDYFAGELDDVTLWKAELNPTAIAQLMTTPPTPAHPQYTNLVAYWPLDEGTGNAVSAAWGRTPAGMLAGGPRWVAQTRPLQYLATPLAAVSGTNAVLDLDGVDDHVRVPAGIWFSNEFTIESWVYERSYNDWTRVIDFGNAAPSDNVLFALSEGPSGKPRFEVYRGAATQGITAADPIAVDQWVHLAATLKTNWATIYVNGVAVVSGTVTAPNAVNRLNNYIGRSAWSVNAYANALFDELRLWKVARTPAQIRQYMTEPVDPGDTNLLLNYRFDEPSGLTVVDSRTTSPQNGTLTNGASRLPFERVSLDVAGLAPGTRYLVRSVAVSTNGTELGQVESFATPTPVAGTALDFNGANDLVRIAGFGNMMPTTNVTVEFWQRTHSLKAQSTFALEPDSAANRFQAHVPWADGTVYWDFGNIGGAGRLSYIPPASLVGTWQHFAFVSSVAGNYMRIYRNGVQEQSKVGAAPFVRGAYDLVLGRNTSAWPLDAELDEFRVWSVARSGADILRDFNRRLQGNEPGLLVCYHMDEGAGGVLVAATASAKDGLLPGTNSPAWVPSTAPVGWPIVTASEVSAIHSGDVTLNAAVKGDTTSDTRVWVEYGQYVAVPDTAENFFYGYITNYSVTNLGQVNFSGPPAYAGTFTNIKFSVGASSPPPEWPGGPGDAFAVRYLGQLFLPAPGDYTLYASSDDGSQIFIDGALVVNNDGVHGIIERGTSTYLTTGRHWLEVRMFDWYNPAALTLSYAGPGIPKQVIPSVAFQRHEVANWTRTAPQTYPGAPDIQAVSTMVAGLNGSATYVLRVAAANGAGTNYGPEQAVLMGSPGAFTGLFFNGVGACVQVPDGADRLVFPGTDQFTLEAWINPSWIGATQAILSKFNHPTLREYCLALNNSGRVVFHRQGSDYVSSTAVAAGHSTHVAATYDGTRRQIYINGVLDPAVDPGSGSITNWGAPFVIGARYWSNSLADFFPGVIDDVRVWQVARSQTQIAGDMNRRLTGYELGLMAYFRFDEAQGGVAVDTTPYQSMGLLANGAVYVPSAVQFACTSAPPALTVEVLDFAPGVLLWWPITCNEYVLEVADDAQAPPEAWFPVWETVTPIGDAYVVVLLQDQYDQGFFRLRRL